MNDKLTFAAILLGGYLLGRTKKLKMALAVAGALGVRELKEHPDLLKAGGAVLSTPAVKKLTDELSGRLVEAGKTAVVAAATKRVDSLVSNLEERTGSPLASRGGRDKSGSADEAGKTREAGEAEEPADEATPEESPAEDEGAEDTEQDEAKAGTPSEDEEPEDEEPEDEQPQDEDEEPAPKAAPRRRRTTSDSSSRASGQGRSKQGTSAGGAKKSTGTRSTTRSTGGKTTRKGSR
ncbi:hypothetical protein [Promicromonospora sukumoe]|uniref:hypothetical protein n=1 Tax=Promicromonospora sukumoe TaxID=88382 RepID=UPI0036644BBD